MRFRHKAIPLAPDEVLHEYWGAEGYFRPTVDLFLHGPTGVVTERALIDTGSPYIAFDHQVAKDLGLQGRFRRRARARGVGGAEVTLSFPDDGEVQILLTDFTSGYCVWSPLIGFVEEDRPSDKRSAILGFTGFFQYFAVDFRDIRPTAMIEVTAKPSFPGRSGVGRPPGDVWTRRTPT
jgi:hypothetical protein